jgi:hypothetical protein
MAFGWGVRWNGDGLFHLCLCLVENGLTGAVTQSRIYHEDAEPFRSKKRAAPERSFLSLSHAVFLLSPEVNLPCRHSLLKKSPPVVQHFTGAPNASRLASPAPTFGLGIHTASAQAFAPLGRAGGSHRFPVRGTPAWPCRRVARGCSVLLVPISDSIFDLGFQDCRGERRHLTSVVAQAKVLTTLLAFVAANNCRFCLVVNS